MVGFQTNIFRSWLTASAVSFYSHFTTDKCNLSMSIDVKTPQSASFSGYRTSPSACGIHLPFSREDKGTDDFFGFGTNNYALRITHLCCQCQLTSNMFVNRTNMWQNTNKVLPNGRRPILSPRKGTLLMDIVLSIVFLIVATGYILAIKKK